MMEKLNKALGNFYKLYIFSPMRLFKTTKRELPFWHRKKQKAYRFNRVILILQMIAAILLSFIIWFGIAKTIH